MIFDSSLVKEDLEYLVRLNYPENYFTRQVNYQIVFLTSYLPHLQG